ncbi:dipeptide ABC transporter ATP-binding protein [Actinocrispum wychmicini]|uniref:Peptide/nickel transport system ATP-binding protein n=1 Tax=Actinocrispum wychmicini TaxID=1213861 RepID=A0A4R2JYI1_9PSEU|nr:ABC transporter ATP-binding protein [Actinocrispum wychmicini]TCO62319.1 peptide/nickel transport system ATP-binding protein [Actinocrispum wychmicini]
MSTADLPLLAVDGLSVHFGTKRGRVDAVRGISFTVDVGKCLAIVGESGSGKSVTARALLGLAGPGSSVRARKMELNGRDLTLLSERDWRQVRGRVVGLVLQDAMTSLDPVRTVGAEIAETLRNHQVVPRADVGGKVVSLLTEARVPEPGTRARQYPHQLSGGLRQRALIASALAASPPLLIADEPTTALDVTVQARILDLLAERKRDGVALLLISHDLSVVAKLADYIAVMREGAFVEEGPAADVLTSPSHPYTKSLLAAAHPKRARSGASTQVVLEVDSVSKSYRGRAAVKDVSFVLRAGETLGILGESGAGKTTLAQVVLGLVRPDRGSVRLFGHPWSDRPEQLRRADRHRIQFVQQDPASSFDPRYTVARIVGEAVRVPGRQARQRRVADLLRLVGLDTDLAGRRPWQLSGGQRQRVAIARAVAPEPAVLVCDEPVSSLDVSSQAQILDLFADLRERLGLAMVLISHDLGVIRHTSDRLIVLRAGEVVESGQVETVYQRPGHPHTRELLAALPRPPDSAVPPSPSFFSD